MRLGQGFDSRALTTTTVLVACGLGLVQAWTPSSNSGPAQALRSTIAFVSTRHDPSVDTAVDPQRGLLATEIYLMDGDGTNARRVTDNNSYDGFPALSPDGTRIVFDSNRLRGEGDPFNTSHLFVMNVDGTGQTPLTKGSSASWSPDGQRIAFHASASGAGKPIKPDPGAATSDNDIFILNVNDFLKNGLKPKNVTNNPAAIDDDPDWSPDGQTLVFTSHAATDDPINSSTTEIFTIRPDGTGRPTRLTNNAEEERAPSWSPDGKRIVFCCRRGGPDFELCVMNADGTGQSQLTDNALPELTPTWSPDGKQIAFHRRVGERGHFQIFTINADGTGEKQLTSIPGLNGFPNWGEVRGRLFPDPTRRER